MGYNEPDDVAEYLTKCCGEDRCICYCDQFCELCGEYLEECECDIEKEGDNER